MNIIFCKGLCCFVFSHDDKGVITAVSRLHLCWRGWNGAHVCACTKFEIVVVVAVVKLCPNEKETH